MRARLDSTSPIPLYHQIAEAIRTRIRTGELSPGMPLESLRRAASAWGVNLHTVRRAYTDLAREGVVTRRRGRGGGIRVARRPAAAGITDPRDVDKFLDRIQREAREELGLSPRDLDEALHERLGLSRSDRPIVFVVECSEWQCRCHARELEERFRIEARSWPLTTRGEPPEAQVVSTYFHYNDIRSLWPHRLEGISFVTIRPDPALRARLAGEAELLVFGTEPARVKAIAADLRGLFAGEGPRIETLVRHLPALAFPLPDKGPPLLFPPRAWAALDETQRSHARAIELRYLIDPRDMDDLGRRLRWLAA